jgi:predicted deacylase
MSNDHKTGRDTLPLPMKKLSVGSAVAAAGEKVTGFIDVPAGTDAGTRIPVSIIQGNTGGPVLALVAGTHGSEPCPILALQRVRAELDPSQLAGTVILVHVANVPSFVHRTIYRGPWDQKNLNRMFPGRPNGTASERIAYAVTSQVIDQCDYLIDMHSVDGNEQLRPYAYWNHLGADEKVDAIARDMTRAFGLDHIVVDRGRPSDRNATVFCSNTAHVRGKPAVTTEAGEVGVPTEEMVALNVRGAFGVMRYLKMIPGQVHLVDPVWIDPSVVLTSPHTGTWHPVVRADQRVEKGDLLGRITDYFGSPVSDVVAPMSGLLMYVVVSPAISEGEPLAMVGVPTSG